MALTSTPSTLGGSNRLLTPQQVADWLNVPLKTVYAQWREWGLRGLKFGKHLRFRVRDVEHWLETREV